MPNSSPHIQRAVGCISKAEEIIVEDERDRFRRSELVKHAILALEHEVKENNQPIVNTTIITTHSQKENPMIEIFKVQYINKDERDQVSENLPKWKKKVNEINLQFSDLISKMFDLFPHAASVLESSCVDFGNPNDYAKLEVFENNDVNFHELYHDYFYINTETLKITDPHIPGFTGCAETEWYDKYGDNMDGKLY